MSLAKKTAGGIVWTGSSTFVNTAINFVILAVLARILSPSDFGLMGMLMVVINFVILFSDFGLSTAIVQQKELNDENLSTIFFLSIGIGMLLCLICFICSGLMSQVFHEADLSYLLKIASISFIITAFGQTFKAVLQKEMNFKALFKVDVISSIVYGVVSIALAFKGFGVLSLVYGLLMRQLANTFFSYTYNSFTPRFLFNIESIGSLLRFGIYVFGERIVNYFNRNLDYIVIGRILGAEALGYYTLAYNLMLVPISRIAAAVMQVVFPALSIIQEDNERMRKGYLKVIRYIALVTFPIMAMLFAVATEFISIVYGPKWIPTVLVLQILCFVGALQSIGTTVGSVLYAKGRSDIGFKWNCFVVCCYTAAFLVGVKWGIVGVASMYALFGIILMPIIQTITNNLMNLRWKEFAKQFIVSGTGSLILIFVVLIFKNILLNQRNLTQLSILISSILVGSATYTLFVFLNDRKTIIDGLALVRGGLSKDAS